MSVIPLARHRKTTGWPLNNGGRPFISAPMSKNSEPRDDLKEAERQLRLAQKQCDDLLERTAGMLRQAEHDRNPPSDS